jgi:hypothetical protein
MYPGADCMSCHGRRDCPLAYEIAPDRRAAKGIPAFMVGGLVWFGGRKQAGDNDFIGFDGWQSDAHELVPMKKL